MSKIELRQKVLILRKQGKSYGQIKLALGVPKSTLSGWLKDYPLTKNQVRLLRDVSEVRIEKFRQTMLAKRQARLSAVYAEQQASILPLSQRELLVAGLFLYWGEGGKDFRRPLSLHNTNPSIIKFALFWYTDVLMVPKSKIKVYLHLYSDMIIPQEIDFWSKELRIPVVQFAKPYIKKSKRVGLNHKGGFGHGTCGLVVADLRLKERVMMALQAVADCYGNRI